MAEKLLIFHTMSNTLLLKFVVDENMKILLTIGLDCCGWGLNFDPIGGPLGGLIVKPLKQFLVNFSFSKISLPWSFLIHYYKLVGSVSLGVYIFFYFLAKFSKK